MGREGHNVEEMIRKVNRFLRQEDDSKKVRMEVKASLREENFGLRCLRSQLNWYIFVITSMGVMVPKE